MDRYKVSKMEDELLDKDLEHFKDYQGIIGSFKRQIWYSRIKWTAVISTAITTVVLSMNYFTEDSANVDTNSYLESETSLTAEVESQPQKLYFDHLDTVRTNMNASDKSSIVQQPVQEELAETKRQNDKFSFIKAVPPYSLDSALQAAQQKITLKSDKNISGTITVVIVVDDSGRITEPKIISGLEPELDSKILEIIGNLPSWKPASLNNKAVASTVTIPVELSINPLK